MRYRGCACPRAVAVPKVRTGVKLQLDPLLKMVRCDALMAAGGQQAPDSTCAPHVRQLCVAWRPVSLSCSL